MDEDGLGWMLPTLEEYELGDINKLRAMFEKPNAAQTLSELG